MRPFSSAARSLSPLETFLFCNMRNMMRVIAIYNTEHGKKYSYNEGAKTLHASAVYHCAAAGCRQGMA